MAISKSRDHDPLLLNLVNALSDQPRASMGQLATMVGLSRATLCRHFPSRDTMIQTISEAAVTSAELAFARARPNEGAVEPAVRRLIEELLPIAELYAFAWRHEHADEALEARAQPLRESLISLFQQWQSAGELRVDLSAAWLVEAMSALLRSAAAMIRSGRLARHDAVQSVFGLLWHGAQHATV
jgi:AcrR family transcriptional regulator